MTKQIKIVKLFCIKIRTFNMCCCRLPSRPFPAGGKQTRLTGLSSCGPAFRLSSWALVRDEYAQRCSHLRRLSTLFWVQLAISIPTMFSRLSGSVELCSFPWSGRCVCWNGTTLSPSFPLLCTKLYTRATSCFGGITSGTTGALLLKDLLATLRAL